MANFVYVTFEKSIRSIRRSGIMAEQTPASVPDGVHAMPVIVRSHETYKWQQELRHKGQRNLCGVYFQIPDHELVWISLYNELYRPTAAAEAVSLLTDKLVEQDFKLIIPRSISKSEIRQIRYVPSSALPNYQNPLLSYSGLSKPVATQPSYAQPL
jgi:hypothetical protein